MLKFLKDERGATAIEYGLICALIIIACVASIAVLGGGSNGMWTNKVADPVVGAMSH